MTEILQKHDVLQETFDKNELLYVSDYECTQHESEVVLLLFLIIIKLGMN